MGTEVADNERDLQFYGTIILFLAISLGVFLSLVVWESNRQAIRDCEALLGRYGYNFVELTNNGHCVGEKNGNLITI